MTFSIVARAESPSGPEWGVAVASRFLAVGSLVPWARADVGAVATQSFANVSFGPRGLEMLARGAGAAEVCRSLIDGDEERERRQLGLVDASGRAAAFTGSECLEWAGHHVGDGFCCQGNILAGERVIRAMVAAYGSTRGTLAERLLAALRAGDDAGGDSRGKQAASLLVVRHDGGYLSGDDGVVDLRVDDHPEPVGELARLLALHRLYFPRPDQLGFIEIDDDLAAELRRLLAAKGSAVAAEGAGYDQGLRDALFAYVGTENLEMRWSEGPKVEKGVLEHLRSGAPPSG